MDNQYYPSKEIGDRLNVSSSTLRKWCIALEGKEYEFARTEQNRRLFQEHDLTALESLKKLIQERNMTLENASIIVASKFNEERSSSGTPSVREVLEDGEQPQNDDIKEIKSMIQEQQKYIEQQQEYIEKQERFNSALMDKLDEQQKYINEKVESRDRMLMENLNQLSEQRKEEIKLLEEQKESKNWWEKLFGKK